MQGRLRGWSSGRRPLWKPRVSCAVNFPRLFAEYDSHLLTRMNAVHAGQIAGMEQREAAAVEAEDFEMAASLSADLDSLKAQAGSVQADIRSSETACDQAVRPAAL